MSAYFDYRLRFSVSGIARAIAGLRAAGVLGADNMLGDSLNASGVYVSPENAVFYGRRGRASFKYTDEGVQQTAPAMGDPAYIYIHVRSAAEITVNLADYGMETVESDVSATVLGVWA